MSTDTYRYSLASEDLSMINKSNKKKQTEIVIFKCMHNLTYDRRYFEIICIYIYEYILFYVYIYIYRYIYIYIITWD